MRTPCLVAVAILALGGCSKTKSDKPGATDGGAQPSKAGSGSGTAVAADDATVPIDAAPAAAPPGAGTSPSLRARLDDAIENMTPVAFHAAASDRIAWLQRVDVEGTGTMFTLVIASAAGGAPEEVELEDGTDPATLAAAVDRLTKDGFVAIERTAWPEEKDALRVGSLELAWTTKGTRHTLALTAPKAATLFEVADEDPHVPRVAAIHGAKGARAVAVEIDWDPGDDYGEFNRFVDFRAVTLPTGAPAFGE